MIIYVVFTFFYFLVKRRELIFIILISSWFLIDISWLVVNDIIGLQSGRYLLVVSHLNIFILGVLIKFLESEKKDLYKLFAPYILVLLLYSAHVSVQYMFIVIFVFISAFAVSFFKANYKRMHILAFIGRVSYPFYLIHQVVGYCMIYYLEEL